MTNLSTDDVAFIDEKINQAVAHERIRVLQTTTKMLLDAVRGATADSDWLAVLQRLIASMNSEEQRLKAGLEPPALSKKLILELEDTPGNRAALELIGAHVRGQAEYFEKVVIAISGDSEFIKSAKDTTKSLKAIRALIDTVLGK